MRKIIQIILALVIVGVALLLCRQILNPLNFDNEVTKRSNVVIDRIKDIRAAEQSYKQVYGKYCGDFDTLITFVLHDSLTFDKTIGSADDSIAVAKGLYKTEKFKMAVIDTVFGRKVTLAEVRELKYIPFSELGDGGTKIEFKLAAGILETVSGVTVPVFECSAPYRDFLSDLNRQLMVNLIDNKQTIEKYPGIKVGSMEQATNDAGNWE